MKPGYRRPDGTEIRLGSVQGLNLELCSVHPQRRCPGNPTMRALSRHGFVESRQHISERTGRPTLDRIFTITAEGRRYLAEGRDRR